MKEINELPNDMMTDRDLALAAFVHGKPGGDSILLNEVNNQILQRVKDNWEKILFGLKEDMDVSDISFSTWLKPLEPERIEGNQLYVNCVDELFKSYVGRKYVKMLEYEIEEILGLCLKIHLCPNEC